MARDRKDKNDVIISGILIDILSYRLFQPGNIETNHMCFYDCDDTRFFEICFRNVNHSILWQVMGSGRLHSNVVAVFNQKQKKAYDKL
jgi:hypothetical protein